MAYYIKKGFITLAQEVTVANALNNYLQQITPLSRQAVAFTA
jgi:hypothetical protein